MADSRICTHCKKEYYPTRKDRTLKFCISTCSLKVNRYVPKDFWIFATHDMYKRNRSNHVKGEKHPCATITNKIARKIKSLLKDGRSIKYIMELFNIKNCIIYSIKYGKTWRSVNE